MELGFAICAQVVVLAAVSIVPMMILRQNAERSRVRAASTSHGPARGRIGR